MLEDLLNITISFFGVIFNLLGETLSVAITIGKNAWKEFRKWRQ